VPWSFNNNRHYVNFTRIIIFLVAWLIAIRDQENNVVLLSCPSPLHTYALNYWRLVFVNHRFCLLYPVSIANGIYETKGSVFIRQRDRITTIDRSSVRELITEYSRAADVTTWNSTCDSMKRKIFTLRRIDIHWISSLLIVLPYRCVTIWNYMHAILVIPFAGKQRELIQNLNAMYIRKSMISALVKQS